jgi:CheY-like chemotaxis protein
MARLLVVDDVKFILQMVAGIFREHGHEVLTADNGPDALEIAERDRPDLVLLDVAMPGMDGLEVARRLRGMPRTATTPILLITAQPDKKVVARGIEAGADDYLAKPFDTQVLIATAAKLLGGYRMNFSVEAVSGHPLVTVLATEIRPEHAEELEQAVEAGRTLAGPFLLDLSRVTRIDAEGTKVLTARVTEMREEGRRVEVVQPGRGVGTRALISRLEDPVCLHATREEAFQAIGLGGEQAVVERVGLSMVPPAGESLPAREPAAEPEAPREPTACLVESIGKVAMARIRSKNFGDAIPELSAQVLPLAGQDVVLSMKGVAGISTEEAEALAKLAADLRGQGRSLRISSAEPALAVAFGAAGLAGLLPKDSPTRVSS